MADRSDPDMVERVWANWRDAHRHTGEWRDQARESYAFYAGDQWAHEDLQKLRDEQRPPVVFNRIARAINAVIGIEINNRQEIRYIPREQGDAQVNEILSGAAQWVRQGSNAEHEESEAFRDAVICGMGWTDTRLDYERDLDGMIITERFDPFEAFWDPTARARNLADARWLMRVRDVEREDFARLWPDAKGDFGGAPWDEEIDDEIVTRQHVYPQDAYKRQQGGDTHGKTSVRVCQMQWWEQETVWRVDGIAEALSEAEYAKLAAKLKRRRIRAVRQKKRVAKQAFVAGGQILEEGDAPIKESFTLKCVTGQRDRNNNTWLGLVEAMKDPQRWGNKFFSAAIDIINKNSKGGAIAEKASFDDPKAVEEMWARPDAVIWARPGAVRNNTIIPKPIAQLPAGIDRLMQWALENVNDVVGVSAEMLGIAQRNQPGVLEYQRKQAGMTILAHLFDALRFYRVEQGRALLEFIQTYLSDGRLIRITGVQGERFVPLVATPGLARYDVIVDEAPSSPNQREKVWAMMAEMLPIVGKMGIPLPPELLDYSPLPSALAEAWKRQISMGGGLSPEIKQQVDQMQAENQQLKDKRGEKMAELEIKQAEVAADIQLKREQAIKGMELERERFTAEIALERDKMMQKDDLARQKMDMEMRSKMLETTGMAEEQVMQEMAEKIVLVVAQTLAPAIVSSLQSTLLAIASPKTKQIVVHRNRQGLIESADVVEQFPQTMGNA